MIEPSPLVFREMNEIDSISAVHVVHAFLGDPRINTVVFPSWINVTSIRKVAVVTSQPEVEKNITLSPPFQPNNAGEQD